MTKMHSGSTPWRFASKRSPCYPRTMLEVNPQGVVVIFFITETYLTTFVSNFFHLTNFWFDPADAPWVPSHRLPGVGVHPKVTYFITEAYSEISIKSTVLLTFQPTKILNSTFNRKYITIVKSNSTFSLFSEQYS